MSPGRSCLNKLKRYKKGEKKAAKAAKIKEREPPTDKDEFFRERTIMARQELQKDITENNHHCNFHGIKSHTLKPDCFSKGHVGYCSGCGWIQHKGEPCSNCGEKQSKFLGMKAQAKRLAEREWVQWAKTLASRAVGKKDHA